MITDDAEEKHSLVALCYSGLLKFFNVQTGFMTVSMEDMVYSMSNLFKHRFFLSKEHTARLIVHWKYSGAKGCIVKQEKLGPTMPVKEATSFVQKRSDENMNWRNGSSHQEEKQIP